MDDHLIKEKFERIWNDVMGEKKKKVKISLPQKVILTELITTQNFEGYKTVLDSIKKKFGYRRQVIEYIGLERLNELQPGVPWETIIEKSKSERNIAINTEEEQRTDEELDKTLELALTAVSELSDNTALSTTLELHESKDEISFYELLNIKEEKDDLRTERHFPFDTSAEDIKDDYEKIFSSTITPQIPQGDPPTPQIPQGDLPTSQIPQGDLPTSQVTQGDPYGPSSSGLQNQTAVKRTLEDSPQRFYCRTPRRSSKLLNRSRITGTSDSLSENVESHFYKFSQRPSSINEMEDKAVVYFMKTRDYLRTLRRTKGLACIASGKEDEHSIYDELNDEVKYEFESNNQQALDIIYYLMYAPYEPLMEEPREQASTRKDRTGQPLPKKTRLT